MTNPAGADPTSYLLDGWDGVLFGAGSGGISGLQSLSQEAVMIAKQAAIEGNVVLQTILSLIFTGLRDGIPLALSIIEGLAVKLLGLIPGFTTVEEALDAIGQVPLVVDIVQALTGVANGTLTDIESWATALGMGLSDAAALVQAAIDAIANALGHPGTGHTPADLLVYVANIPGDAVSGVTRDWGTALAALQLPNPLALIQQIPQSIPALVRDAEGGLHAVGGGMTRGVDGAIMFVEDGLTHIAKQDGGLLSLQRVTQHMVHVADVISPTLNAGVADVMSAGQTAHTALTGAIEQADVTVEGDIVAGANALGGVVGTAQANSQGLVTGINNAAAGLLTGGSALLVDAQTNMAALLSGPVRYLQGLSGIFGQDATNEAYAAAAAQSAAHAAEIAAQQSAFNAVFNVGPSTAGNINVTADFTGVANQAGMSGIMLPGTSSGSGFMGVTSGEVAWQGGASTPDVEVFPTQVGSDYVVAEFTLGNLRDLLSGNVVTAGVIRCNSARNTYVAIGISALSGSMFVSLQSYVSGSPAAFSAASAALSLSSGGKIRAVAGDPSSVSPYAFQVLYNGTPIITTTDSSHISQIGSGQRYVGLSEQSTVGGQFPAQIKTVIYQDNPPPPSSYPYSGLPTAGTKGREYWPNDVGLALRDNGSAWETIWGGPLSAFTKPPSSGWSSVTAGTTTFAADKDAMLLTGPSIASGETYHLWVRTLSPASNYIASFYNELLPSPGTNNILSIILRESSSGKFVAMEFGVDTGVNASTWWVRTIKWNSVSSASTQYTLNPGSFMPSIPSWMRWRDDGTNRYAEASWNGLEWLTILSVGRTDFVTPDQIGVGILNSNSGYPAFLRMRSLAGVS